VYNSIIYTLYYILEEAMARVGPGIDSRWCHWIFQWHTSFRPYHGPGVGSVPSENEYQEHSWG